MFSSSPVITSVRALGRRGLRTRAHPRARGFMTAVKPGSAAVPLAGTHPLVFRSRPCVSAQEISHRPILSKASRSMSTSAPAPAAPRQLPTLRPVAELEGKLQFLKVSQSSNGVMFLEPNNPPVNALRSEMLDDFELLATVLQRKDCPTRVIVLKCDVAGANIKEMVSQSAAEAEAYSKRFKAALESVRKAQIPLIGYTNRYALGGGLELLMFCDIRYAGPRALLQAPEVDLDTLQSFGGCVVLPRLLSPSVAYRAQMRGDAIPLDVAERDGLITEVIRDDDPSAAENRAFDDAILIAQKRPSTVRLNTQVVRYALGEGAGEPEKAHALESKNFGLTFEGGAHGMQAFLDRLRFQTWGHAQLGGSVENIDFKSMGIDTKQIQSVHARLRELADVNQAAASESDKFKAVFFNGAVSGGDVKKLYQAVTTDEKKFEEFLRLEYQWHESMRSHTEIPLFFFGSSILGGGGLGVFQSMKYRVCQPDTVFMMPEIAIGACPDVAGTYDLPRLSGNFGRGMAIAALELSGVEAKKAGLTDFLVDASLVPALKDAVLDALLQGGDVESVLAHYQGASQAASPELERHSELEWASVFDAKKSLREIVALARTEAPPKEGKAPKSLLQRVQANWQPHKASAYGVILSEQMFNEGRSLSLTQARALEYGVWLKMDKTDFVESINSRFILPRKQRRAPQFSAPGIMDLEQQQFDDFEGKLNQLVQGVKAELPEIESKLFGKQ